jgi:hypothetical protein
VMESCQTLFMEKLVIGLSHFWSAYMMYVGWIQHTVNLYYIVYRNDDVESPIDDALNCYSVPHVYIWTLTKL